MSASDDHATRVGHAVLALFAALGLTGHSARDVYTQHDLPPDAESADSYKRRHRKLRKAQVSGVWTRGKTLACTPEAWAHDLPRATKPTLTLVPTTEVDLIDQALGIKTRAR